MPSPATDCYYAFNWRITRAKNSLNSFIFQEDDCASHISEPCAAHSICKGCSGSQLCEFRRDFKSLPSSCFPIKNAFPLGSQPERAGSVFGCFERFRQVRLWERGR